MDLIGNLIQTASEKVDTLEVQNGSKIIILHRDRRFCVHEHDYKALRVIVEVNKTKTKEVVQKIKELRTSSLRGETRSTDP